MEKTIKFEDVIAFIRKAMNDNLKIEAPVESGESITIYNSYGECFIFDTFKNIFYINTPNGYFEINISNEDYNLYKVILDSVRNYIHDVGIKEFTDFFKDDENRVKDINDLDNDEE